MGWKDAPIVSPPANAQPAWMQAPVVAAPKPRPQPNPNVWIAPKVDPEKQARALAVRKATDIANSHGIFDRGRALLARGTAGFDAGISRLIGANERAERMEIIRDAKLPGEASFEDVKTLAPAKIGQFILEQGVQSIPAMGAMIASLPTFIASQTGSIGQQRAVNDGRETASWGDSAVALPVAAASAVLDRFGFGKLIKPGAGNVVVRGVKRIGTEGGTEGVQSAAEYAGGSVGTETGFDPATALDQSLGGALAGAGMGAGFHGAIETPRAVGDAVRGARVMGEALRLEAPLPDPQAPLEPLSGPREAWAAEPEVKMPETTPAARAPAPTEAVDPQPVAASQPAAAGSDGLGQVDPGVTDDGKPMFKVGQNAPAPAEAVALRPEPGELADGERLVRTPAGGSLRTRFEVVDTSELTQAEGDNQNRDRSRETTTLQVQDIISKFDPEQLHEDASSDRGAPIVGADGAIDSGNGRMLAINRIYDEQPELAAKYRAMIEARGLSTEGKARPVLIQRRMTDFTPEQRRQFVIDSNKDTKLALSPVEVARSDAGSITPEMLARYNGGDLNSSANTGFVEAFAKRLTTGELGNFIGTDRRLTSAGLERVENAVVAAAYGKPKLLERMMESTQDDIKAITSSLADVAPLWARMRQKAKGGEIDARYDITDALADAAARVSDARKRGTPPGDILSQSDAFDQMAPETAEIVRAFYNTGMTRPASKKAVTEFLREYVAKAEAAAETDGLFGKEPAPPPLTILKAMLAERDNPNGATMFDRAEPKEKADVLQSRKDIRRTADEPEQPLQQRPVQRGPDAGSEPGTDADQGRPDERGISRSEIPGRAAVESRGGRAGDGRGSDSEPGRSRAVDGAADGERLQPGAEGRPAAGAGPGASGGPGAGPSGVSDLPRAGSDRLKAIAAAADVAEDEEPGYGLEDKGAYDPTFEQSSFTDRASIYNLAAEELGLDPDRFALLPAPRQVALLRQAMRSKFGISVDVDTQMQDRFAIDQMLDAIQNVHGMAHVLDLPPGAMSFGGKLSLRLQKRGNFLGQFQSGTNIITLPKRSNSFAHEWGHALDYFLLDKLGESGRGLSGAIRKGGAKVDPDGELPKDIREAFVALLNAMFFDKAGVAAKIMALEAKAAATKGPKAKAAALAAIGKLKAGNSQVRDIRSAFYEGAKNFDGPGGDYWTSPTEMLARSFEAYTSYKVEAAGLTTEFIGKGDAQYLDGAGSRFELTFPKGEERAIIFAAYEHLFGLVGDAHILGAGPAAAKPAGTVRRMTDYDRTPKVAKERGVIKRELTAIKHTVRRAQKERADRANDPKGTLEKIRDLNGAVFMSMTGNLRMIQARSGSSALQRLIDMLTKQDGRGDRTVGRTFAEDVHLQSKASVNRLGNILKENGADNLDAEDTKLLRDLLTEAKEGAVDVPPGMEHIVKAAAEIRHLLDNEFYVNQGAGIDLGYTRNGYLSRVLDLPRVYNDQPGFVAAGEEVYKIVFDNDYGSPDALLGNDEMLPLFMRLAGFLAKKGYELPTLDAVRKLMKELARAAAAAERAAKGPDDAGPAEAKVAKLSAELEELFPELHAEVRVAYAKERAEAWLAKINLVAGEEHNASSPDSHYTKSRTLPPEADKLMEKFYIADPVESVTNYLVMSARRTAYARRFGADGKRRKALFERMAAEGVTPDDQRTVERVLDTATGRRRSELPKAVQDTAAFVNAAGTMALLPRATISSLAEPFTGGLITGDSTTGFRHLGMIIGGALGSPSGRDRFELARAMGIVSDVGSDGIMEARYGQTFADATRWDRYTSTMFRRTGLTGLTRAQATANVGIAHAFFDNLSLKIEGKPGKARDGAIALFREMGVRDPEQFAAEMLKRNRFPTLEELETPFGHEYATAQLRYGRMAVQQPDAMDRPELAQNPVGRVIYGITGFSYAYWRNVMKRNAILLGEMGKREGGTRAVLYGGQLFGAAAIAYLLAGTISTIRERLLNPKRWHELEKKGELEKQMAQLAFTRTFAFGAADTVIQTWSGLKYQRDLSNVFVGPGPGFALQNIQKIAPVLPTPAMAPPFVNPPSQSRKTNTGEYNAMQGTYSLASPFLAFGLSRIPGGPMTDIGTGVGMAYVTSAAARDTFATAVVGPKAGSPTPDGGKVKREPTRYDKALDGVFGEKAKKSKADAPSF